MFTDKIKWNILKWTNTICNMYVYDSMGIYIQIWNIVGLSIHSYRRSLSFSLSLSLCTSLCICLASHEFLISPPFPHPFTCAARPKPRRHWQKRWQAAGTSVRPHNPSNFHGGNYNEMPLTIPWKWKGWKLKSWSNKRQSEWDSK